MDAHVIRHFAQVLFAPLLGVSLAWLGPALILHYDWLRFVPELQHSANSTPLYLFAAAVSLTVLLISTKLAGRGPLLLLCVGSLGASAGLLFALLAIPGYTPLEFGNLGDFAWVPAILLLGSCVSANLRFPARASIEAVRETDRPGSVSHDSEDGAIAEGFGYPPLRGDEAFHLWDQRQRMSEWEQGEQGEQLDEWRG